jgi:hypothetical protein
MPGLMQLNRNRKQRQRREQSCEQHGRQPLFRTAQCRLKAPAVLLFVYEMIEVRYERMVFRAAIPKSATKPTTNPGLAYLQSGQPL